MTDHIKMQILNIWKELHTNNKNMKIEFLYKIKDLRKKNKEKWNSTIEKDALGIKRHTYTLFVNKLIAEKYGNKIVKIQFTRKIEKRKRKHKTRRIKKY